MNGQIQLVTQCGVIAAVGAGICYLLTLLPFNERVKQVFVVAIAAITLLSVARFGGLL